MKRRGFFAALAGLCLAPLGVGVAARSSQPEHDRLLLQLGIPHFRCHRENRNVGWSTDSTGTLTGACPQGKWAGMFSSDFQVGSSCDCHSGGSIVLQTPWR